MTEHRTSFVTPSHAPDFDRCELLLRSRERYVSGLTQHYVIVTRDDYPLFQQLQRPGVTLLVTEDVMSTWTLPVNLHRRVWLNTVALPVRGWIMQQLVKIELAASLSDDAVVFIDSDCAFVRPFDSRQLIDAEGRLRLFQVPELAIAEQQKWHETAHRLLGISAPVQPRGYIGNPVSWKPTNARSMISQLESVNDQHWTTSLMRTLTWSEYILYGDFCEHVLGLGPSGHFTDSTQWCAEHWDETPMNRAQLAEWFNAIPATVPLAMISAKSGTAVADYEDLVFRVADAAVAT